jgi:cysteine-rich repeat protein
MTTRRDLIALVLIAAACESGSDGDAVDGDADTGATTSDDETGDEPDDTDTSGPDSSSSEDGSDGDSDEDSDDGDPPDPSAGHESACGDHLLDAGERCDDGNANDGDGCEADCTHTPGTIVWTSTWDAYGDDVGEAIAVDGDGATVVVGTSETGFFSNDEQFWVGKFDVEGEGVWYEVLPELDGNAPKAVDIDSQGNAVVLGTNAALADDHLWLRKYDADGAAIWTADVHGGAPGEDDRGDDLVVDGDEGIVVLGRVTTDITRLWLRRYDADGNPEWTITEDDFVGGEVAIAADGSIVVNGQSAGVATIRRYDGADGAQLWSHSDAAFGGSFGRIALDGTGGFALTRTVDGTVDASDDDIWVGRYDANADELWTLTLDGDGDWDRGFGIATDADDNILVTGQWTTMNGYTGEIPTIKIDPEGTVTWMTLLPSLSCAGNAITVGADGYIYLGGRSFGASTSDVFVQKVAP